MGPAQPQQPVVAHPLSLLAGLGQRARKARNAAELGFVMVNETHALAPYRQAVLWSLSNGIVAVSGVSTIDAQAPFILWLDRLCRRLSGAITAPRALRAQDCDAALAADWDEWLPTHAFFAPLRDPDGKLLGLLGFMRTEPWREAETLFLAEAAEIYAVSWAWRSRPSLWSLGRTRFAQWPRRWLAIAAALFLIAIFPVRLSVLAPGEIVARDPVIMRAPLDGVVDRLLVHPNERVSEGEPLFELDTTSIRGKLDVARKALATAKAEYEQTAQQAFFDPRSKAQLGVLRGNVEQRQAELAYLTDLLERATVRAPRSGVALINDPSEWIGRPVTIGERVLAIADEHDTELEAWLSPADTIDLAAGAPVTLFLNVAPLSPVHAALDYVAYESLLRPDGTVAHRLRASLASDEAKPRLGLKGTARIDGTRVPLIYWLLRRPFGAIRQTLGV